MANLSNKKILRHSYRQPHHGGATRRVLSKSQNPCRWTLRSDMPWWGSFFLRPLTYLSTLYISTIVLLVLVPMYVKPTCREPTETTRHCRGLKWATCDVGLVTCCRHVSRHDIVAPKLPTPTSDMRN